MKTDALIDMLARDAGPAPRALAARRLASAAGVGLMLGAVAALAAFGAIPSSMYATHVPWMKIAYASALALAAGSLTARLSRPAVSIQRARYATAGVIAVMAAIGLVSSGGGTDDARAAAWLGESWLACPWRVLVLSLPALAATFWAVRGLAPTRLRLTGFAAGMLAGSIGALGYSLACPEASPAFVALWYTLGILLTGAVGAAAAPRVLRW